MIKRHIGLKKDEFYINEKPATFVPPLSLSSPRELTKTGDNSKQEVTSLLESAGFSRSNPYYIVQQGKVSALTTMKDKDRLELLKEVAGTHVYEDKKRESLKIIAEADARKEKVEQVIEYVDARLAELAEEKDELTQFQHLDRTRRGLEYAIYEKQRQEALQKLADVLFLPFSSPSLDRPPLRWQSATRDLGD